MKHVLLICCLSLGLLFAQETKVETFDLAPGLKVDIHNKCGGSITIEGWEQNGAELTINYRGDASDWDTETALDNDGLKIVMRCRGNSDGSAKVHLKVPTLQDVKFYTSGGDIDLTGLEGQFKGKTMGGDITLKKLTGHTQISTMGGDIRVEASELDGKVKTMGGDIRFKDVLGKVDGSTMGGNVVYDNVRTGLNANSVGTPEDVVKVSTMGGEIRVEDAPLGAKLSTMGGEIEVVKAGKFVSAKTMGGDIDIQEIDGWVKATTMGGNVGVKMVGDPSVGRRDVTISSMGGEITLYVPRALSMNFDITLKYSKNSKRDYKINSDFAMDQEESEEWQWFGGKKLRTIRGTGSVNGGEHTIKIETNNGNVNIKAVD
ncbi:DUF4097 family beta strand repeat-containing protein [Acanthopleuribacter pedis]|uniref:Adhesin domain-containing protein n=1 Tax=Acanthopleuribacter pedis TaxID=442870 RepID=A0A8J7U2F8_9BACT|nr:DUF4097 family beta strand repeat-containing protein [Acanthopleuribacter pedis]MBO1317669.1 hypothetical protein [Acanthopleuribacter pedis]